MIKWIAVAALVVASLYIYHSADEGRLSAADKINIAYPLSDSLKLTEEKFWLAFGVKVDEHSIHKGAYKIAKQNRALNCSKDINISASDSIETIKSMPVDKECLKTEDQKLANLIGSFHLSILLSKPNIRASAEPGDPKPIYLGGMKISSSDLSYQSGVGIFGGMYGDFASVDLNTGRKIADIPGMKNINQRGSFISPNGKIIAALSSGYAHELSFIDTETGEYIWSIKGVTSMLAWLPEVNGILVTGIDSKRSLRVIDIERGELSDYKTEGEPVRWVLSDSHNTGRILMGGYYNFYSATHKRTASGIDVEIIDRYKISEDPSKKEALKVGSYRPTLVLNGKAILFVTNKDRLMLYTMAGRVVNEMATEGLFQRPSPISVNGSQVILSMKFILPNRGMTIENVVLDLNDFTLHRPLSPAIDRNGGISRIRNDDGYVYTYKERAWIGKKIETEKFGSLYSSMADSKIFDLVRMPNQ